MDKAVMGKRVRRQREKMCLTRDEFAEKIGISPQFLAELENGKKGMSADTLYHICLAADVSADYILMGKQSVGELLTPAAEKLQRIPTKYTEVIEDVLDAFLRTIELAEPDRER